MFYIDETISNTLLYAICKTIRPIRKQNIRLKFNTKLSGP